MRLAAAFAAEWSDFSVIIEVIVTSLLILLQ